MIKKRPTPTQVRQGRQATTVTKEEPPRTASTAPDALSAQSVDAWPLILRAFRLRLLKAHLRGAKEDVKIKSPTAAAVLALILELQEMDKVAAPSANREGCTHPTAQELAHALEISSSQFSEYISALLDDDLCEEQACDEDRRHSLYKGTDEGKKQLEKWLEQEMGLARKHYELSDSAERAQRVERTKRVVSSLSKEIREILRKCDIPL